MRTLKENQHGEIDLPGFWLALRLWFGSKSHEPTIRAKAFRRHRCSGLSQDIKRKQIKVGAAGRSVAHRSRHALSDNCAVLRRDIDDGALDLSNRAIISESGLKQMPTVY